MSPSSTSKDFPLPQLGIDESGRGSVCGPMVICGVLLTTETDFSLISDLRVRDSKKLTAKQRRNKAANFLLLERENPGIWSYSIAISAQQVDEGRALGINLDAMERQMIYSVIHAAAINLPEITSIIVDGQLLTKEFKQLINQSLPDCIIHQEPKADNKFLTVATASILAKVDRDLETEKIMGKHFHNGKGYPNPGTADWIKQATSDQLTQVRKSWSWYRKNFQ